jgi:hypothetical protein
MAFTAADLAAIDAAIVTLATRGAAEVEINGRRVKYTKLSELMKARNDIMDEINGADEGGSMAIRFDSATG